MSGYDCHDHQNIRYPCESEHITDSMEHDTLAPSHTTTIKENVRLRVRPRACQVLMLLDKVLHTVAA
jgi:hypothetical protein